MKRPVSLYLLLVLHFLLGFSGTISGALLVIRPDGSLLALNKGWLSGSPFTSYQIPGVVLFTFLGILPLMVLTGSVVKPEWKFPKLLNLYSDMHWAWAYSLYTGIISILWIIVQQLMTSYFWLQPLIMAMGVLIIIFTIMPPTMRYFKLDRQV